MKINTKALFLFVGVCPRRPSRNIKVPGLLMFYKCQNGRVKVKKAISVFFLSLFLFLFISFFLRDILSNCFPKFHLGLFYCYINEFRVKER